MSRKRYQDILFLVLVASAFFPGGNLAMAIETADYVVIETDDDFELRRYAPQILAETTVSADFDNAGNQAFRRLFNYISGANRAQSKIAMTAPVSQEVFFPENRNDCAGGPGGVRRLLERGFF